MECLSISRLVQLDVKWVDHFTADEHFYQTVKSNPYYQLLIVTEGPINLRVEQEKVVLHPGEVYFLLPWQHHGGWLKSAGGASFFWVQFSANPPLTVNTTWMKPSYKLNHVQKKSADLRTITEPEDEPLLLPSRFMPSRRYEMFSLFEKLWHVSTNPDEYFRFHSTLLLGEMIRVLAGDFLAQCQIDTSLPVSFRTYRAVVKYLNEFYLTNLSKETMETKLLRKYEYLSQVFKQYSGMTITHYIQQLRIQKAKHLLLNSSLQIQEIAQNTGFSDPYYFSRIFKKLAGASPAEYRKLLEQLPGGAIPGTSIG